MIPKSGVMGGKRVSWKFSTFDRLLDVFDFCEWEFLKGAEENDTWGEVPSKYRIVNMFPRELLPERERSGYFTLDSLGMKGRVNLGVEVS